MCGHVGIAGNMGQKDEMLMKRLLVLDYFRGMDSTGLASIRGNGEVKVAKLASHPFDLFDCSRFNNTLNGYQSLALIGHNRAATRGKVNTSNAHPFECDHIVGAHNGTLDVPCKKLLDEANGFECGTDSEAIFWHIAKFGVNETIPKLQGAWALVWYDAKEDAMFFIRNKERPLWYAYSKDFKKILWSSEWEFIKAANDLLPAGNRTELYQDAEKGYRYWGFEIDKLYVVHLDTLTKGSDSFPNFIKKELKGKEVVVTTHSGNGTPFVYGTPSNNVSYLPPNRNPGTGTTATGTSSTTTSHSKGKLSHIHLSADEPWCGVIDKDRFDEVTRFGCSWCGNDMNFEDTGTVIYDHLGACLCSDCASGDKTNRLYLEQDEMENLL